MHWYSNYYWLREQLESARFEAMRARIQARSVARRSEDATAALEEEIAGLQLVVHALLEVLRSKGLFDGAALAEAMEKIDLEDGVRDGRITPPEPIPPAESPRRTKPRGRS